MINLSNVVIPANTDNPNTPRGKGGRFIKQIDALPANSWERKRLESEAEVRSLRRAHTKSLQALEQFGDIDAARKASEATVKNLVESVKALQAEAAAADNVAEFEELERCSAAAIESERQALKELEHGYTAATRDVEATGTALQRAEALLATVSKKALQVGRRNLLRRASKAALQSAMAHTEQARAEREASLARQAERQAFEAKKTAQRAPAQHLLSRNQALDAVEVLNTNTLLQRLADFAQRNPSLASEAVDLTAFVTTIRTQDADVIEQCFGVHREFLQACTAVRETTEAWDIAAARMNPGEIRRATREAREKLAARLQKDLVSRGGDFAKLPAEIEDMVTEDMVQSKLAAVSHQANANMRNARAQRDLLELTFRRALSSPRITRVLGELRHVNDRLADLLERVRVVTTLKSDAPLGYIRTRQPAEPKRVSPYIAMRLEDYRYEKKHTMTKREVWTFRIETARAAVADVLESV